MMEEERGANRGRGRGRNSGAPRASNSEHKRAVRISKTLSYLLRHGALKEGLHMSSSGWVEVTYLGLCKHC